MRPRRSLLLAGLIAFSLGLAMLLSASTFAGPAASRDAGPLTIVEIEAGCAPAGVTGSVTVANTSGETVEDTLPFQLMQHIPPPRGGQAQFFPVPAASFTVSVTIAPDDEVVVPFGPISTAAVDSEANALRVDTDVDTRPDLNPEKSESFPPCPAITPTATATPVETFTPTATGTATPVDTFTPTATGTATAVDTFTPTATGTAAPVDTFTATATGTATSVDTPTVTTTPVDTATPTQVATLTLTPTNTAMAVATFTHTPTPTTTTGPSPTATRTAVPTSSPTPTDTVIAATPTLVNITLPGTPPPRLTPVPRLPDTGGPADPGSVPAWWLFAGAMMAMAGAALVFKAFAEGRQPLPATLYLEISGLEGFRDFYETVAALRERISARTTTAVSFFATQGRAQIRVDGVAGDEASLREAALRANRRGGRVRRERDRVHLDLD